MYGGNMYSSNMYSSNMQQQLNQIFGLMGGFFRFLRLVFCRIFPHLGNLVLPKNSVFLFGLFLYILLVIMSGGLVLNNDGSETERFNCTTRSNWIDWPYLQSKVRQAELKPELWINAVGLVLFFWFSSFYFLGFFFGFFGFCWLRQVAAPPKKQSYRFPSNLRPKNTTDQLTWPG